MRPKRMGGFTLLCEKEFILRHERYFRSTVHGCQSGNVFFIASKHTFYGRMQKKVSHVAVLITEGENDAESILGA